MSIKALRIYAILTITGTYFGGLFAMIFATAWARHQELWWAEPAGLCAIAWGVAGFFLSDIAVEAVLEGEADDLLKDLDGG